MRSFPSHRISINPFVHLRDALERGAVPRSPLIMEKNEMRENTVQL